ncbi:MAG: alanine--glyoxylate aminotransferase family protein, partial [Gemmatimonadota bacterium]|nr:alanine--glyoxylate aminotransferase family protein [Gemmatimonadota bacterium]
MSAPSSAPLLLMTPGPTRLPERVLRAGARPMIHHRTAEFSAELASMLELLRPAFGTREPVLPVHTTGRGAMEATICNLFSAGDEIAVCCNGRFGEFWARFAESYGLVVHRVAEDWERDADPAELDALLAARPAVKAVAMSYGDTSTGVANDVAGIAHVARTHGVLTLVDGVSSIVGMPFAFDEWGVDVAIVASQKCLMSSPGLAFTVVSDRAWAASETARLPRNYWDFAEIRRQVTKAKPETPGTPPVHVVLQVGEALRMLHEETLPAVQQRHAELAAATRDGVAALGLAPQCPALRRRATTLTAVALPAELPPERIR